MTLTIFTLQEKNPERDEDGSEYSKDGSEYSNASKASYEVVLLPGKDSQARYQKAIEAKALMR